MVAAALLTNACASGDEVHVLSSDGVNAEPASEAALPQPTELRPEQAVLELEVLTEDNLRGTYRRGSLTLGFSAGRSEAGLSWGLSKGDGTELYRFDQIGESVVISVLGGYRQYMDQQPLAELNGAAAGSLDEATVRSLIPSEGDPALLQDLLAMEEYEELPLLSESLGQHGVTGSAYPIALPIHAFAMGASKMAGAAQVPNSSEPDAAPEVAALHLQGFQGGGLSCTRSGTQTCCVSTVGQRTCFTTPPPPPPPPPCAPAYPGDLRCDPNNDGCLGLCGDDCSCWDWVCGDCRWHFGCYQHDWFCLQAETASWWDWATAPALYAFYTAQCVGGPSLVVAALGCTVTGLP